MTEQKAILHHEYGKPDAVLRVESIPLPEVGREEVRVRLLAAAINPSDYGMIGGSYGRLRDLPAVAGREGVGEVEALGEGVAGRLKVGQRVRFPGEAGAWQEFACISADAVLPVPQLVPIEQAAVSFINPPTAFCLLKYMVDLKPGDWVLQNAGNSAVGVAVIQMARLMGLKTISQVRREVLFEPLQALGGDVVVLEGSDWTRSIQEQTDGASPRLALNSIGGGSAIDQIKVLSKGGTQVTFGGMVGDKVRFPTRFLIFNDVRLRGFWWDQWMRAHDEAALREVMNAVYGWMMEGSLKMPIEASYAFEDFQSALKHDKAPRLGKILLRPE